MTTTKPWPAWNGVRALDWYHLIHQAEMIREHYYLGLASVWGYIHKGDYANARARLDIHTAGDPSVSTEIAEAGSHLAQGLFRLVELMVGLAAARWYWIDIGEMASVRDLFAVTLDLLDKSGSTVPCVGVLSVR